jgi:hypothetical protein
MNPFRSFPRRRRKTVLSPELLETRELLTGGSNTFAIIPGTVSTNNGTTSIQFTIDPTNFTLPKRALTLGIDVVANTGSTIKPFIESIDDPHGNLVPQAFHSIYNPHLSHLAVASGQGTSAVLVPLTLFPHGQTKPATYTVNVQALGNTSGSFLLGFYLPGDANGDGTVNQADIQIVKADQGARAGSTKYNFNADTNRDGRIGKIDLAFTQQNLGVSTNISPVVQANLDQTNLIAAAGSQVSSVPNASYTGTATPGTTITYANTDGSSTTTTTADSTGNYSITVPLNVGVNTFQVTSKDAFGQVISGAITPVSYLGQQAQSSTSGS